MHIVYLEKSIVSHPRTQRILQKLKPEQIILCDNYKEVFNPRAQNFRRQKQSPAVILAEKKGTRIFSAPAGFGIGGEQNYYFSHLLNCPYDCRYCFLQGMYSSANYVIFINYEEYMADIKVMNEKAAEPLYFFSGYDGDSLAFEPVTHFVKEFLPFFRTLDNAILELRTKSTNVKELLRQTAFPHCVVAFSLTPEEISQLTEHKVPAVAKRLQAMRQVAEKGWPIGLRFDPLIYHPDFKRLYEKLIAAIFAVIQPQYLHSVSLGPLRFPEKMYQKIVKLYPQDPLLAGPLYSQGKVVSYPKELEQRMKSSVQEILKQYVDQTLLFECHV